MALVYLGVDIGTTSAKCMAVDESGRILALAQHPYFVSHPREGWAEQDPNDYWRALVDVVCQCLQAKQFDARDVFSVSLSTQGGTLIVTSRDGQPLIPAISWMDARADKECEELLAETGASFWYRETGQPLTPLSSACKIRWLERHMPDLWRKARFGWVGDYLAYKLCGRLVADVPSASWTSLFSPSRRAWCESITSLLRLGETDLPEIAESGEVIGEIGCQACQEIGLPSGVRLIAGAFDQAAAAHGAGASLHGKSVLSCGTAWVLYSVADKPILDPNEHLCICCHVTSDEWGMVLPFPGGAVYDWLQGIMRERGNGAGGDHEPLIFIPHLYGGLSPDWRKESKGSLVGLTMSHTTEDIRLGVMRGIACEAKRNLEASEALLGRTQSIRMVGGAGKSEVWPQLLADVLNRQIEVSQITESACLGAAKLAAGQISRSWLDSGPARVYIPKADRVGAEEAFYRRYLRFYEVLAELYRE